MTVMLCIGIHGCFVEKEREGDSALPPELASPAEIGGSQSP